MQDLRQLPKVDELARSPELAAFSPAVRTKAARAAINARRAAIQAGDDRASVPLASLAEELAVHMAEPSLKPAINLSGVILHTGLGRARLAPSVAEQVSRVAASHSAIELDLDSGQRGERQNHVRDLLCELTRAEDALVSNNAAAGVLLTLTALCVRQEVVLSRGQMVEIGGSFRMPDIVKQSGCTLVEVGCTNKTRVADYEEVINEQTRAILRCHPSNFKIVGFSEEPSIESLAALCRERGLLLIDDQGSGCIVDLSEYGLPAQPTLPGSVKGGADVAIASGDKLLGGPQCGIVVGHKHLIKQIKNHPLARAVRVDKLTLSALEATLRLYLEKREKEIPVIKYLSRNPTEIKKVAQAIAKAYKPGTLLEQGVSEVGGGSVPGEGLPTWRVGLKTDDPEGLARKLRCGHPPIIGRIERDSVWLDPRTLEEGELKEVVQVLNTF